MQSQYRFLYDRSTKTTLDINDQLLADAKALAASSSLVIYSVLDRTFHAVKSDHPCLSAEDWIMQTPYGPNRLLWGLLNFAVGIDGIEISEDQKWLYLAPMTNSRLCRIPMIDVLNPSLSPETFKQSVEDIGRKPMSDGIAIDRAGRVVITDVEHGGIMAFDPATKQLSKLGRSKNMVWPDGIVVANDGDVYFTDSAIPSYIDQLVRPPEEAKLQQYRPYFIYRLKKNESRYLIPNFASCARKRC